MSSASGTITSSSDVVDATNTKTLSTITGSIGLNDVIAISFQNNKIRNPLSTGIYEVTINTYDSF